MSKRMIGITLEDEERSALFILAERERRELRAQAAMLIREALERRGLLPKRDDAGNAIPNAPRNNNEDSDG